MGPIARCGPVGGWRRLALLGRGRSAAAPAAGLLGRCLAVLGLVTVCAACWPTAPLDQARQAADVAPAAAPAPVAVEAAASEGERSPVQPSAPAPSDLDFSIATLAGERFRLSERRGKVIGVLFMASWCATCVPEAQAWARLAREYEDRGLEVLLVSADPADTPDDLEGFKKLARGPERHWAIDRDSTALVLPFQVRMLDTTLIFDRQGRLAYRDEIPTPYARLKQHLEKLL